MEIATEYPGMRETSRSLPSRRRREFFEGHKARCKIERGLSKVVKDGLTKDGTLEGRN